MLRTSTFLRRAVGVAATASVAFSGLVVAGATAAHAESFSCSAYFDNPSIEPGESATLFLTTADGEQYPAIRAVDGHNVPGTATTYGSGYMPLTYAEWKTVKGAAGSSVGYRLYAPGTDVETVSDQDEWLCGAEVTLVGEPSQPPEPQDQTIDFEPIGDHALTAGVTFASATATSGLDVTLQSRTPEVCEVLSNQGDIALLARGRCTIAANQKGDEEFNAAPEAEQSFWVQVPQTITFPLIERTPLSVGRVSLNATASSGWTVAYETDTPDVCTITAPPAAPPVSSQRVTAQGAPAIATVDLVGRGQCHVIASQAGGDEWLPAEDSDRWFTVQAPQALTFSAIPDTLLSAGSVELDANATSGGWIYYTVADPSVCDVPILAAAPKDEAGRTAARMSRESTTLTLKKVGTCTVTAEQVGGGEWLPSNQVTRSFKVYEKAAAPRPVIELRVPAGVALSAGEVAVDATSNVAGRAVTVTSTSRSVCAVTGRSVTLKKAGTCTLAAAQAGAKTVTQSFPVWGAPAIPAKGKTTQTVSLLGRGESDLQVTATPASVCSATDGEVLLIARGRCTVEITRAAESVRSGTIKVAYAKSDEPDEHLTHGGTAYFAYDSAKLTAKAKKALRGHLATLRKAEVVIVYGNTYGPGKNSDHSRELAAKRAAAVVKFLRAHGVGAKAVKVAAAMENPVSDDPAKNRRADVYYRN